MQLVLVKKKSKKWNNIEELQNFVKQLVHHSNVLFKLETFIPRSMDASIHQKVQSTVHLIPLKTWGFNV